MHSSAIIRALESVTYTMPHTPKVTMADFYMLSWIATVNPEALVKSGITGALRIDLEDVRHAEDVLYPALREQLLSDVFFALSCEIRHVFDNQLRDLQLKKSKFMVPYYRAWRSYTGNVKDPDQPADRGKFSSDQRGYQDSYAAVRDAMSKTGMGKEAVVAEMEMLFREATWDRNYGGKAWADIASGWLRLNRARTRQQMSIAIDHVYDLQHNTGTVFNKLQRYYSDGGHDWIKQSLDFKAQLKNIRDLLPMCSSMMKRLARPVLKAAGVTGLSGETADQVAANNVKSGENEYSEAGDWVEEHENRWTRSYGGGYHAVVEWNDENDTWDGDLFGPTAQFDAQSFSDLDDAKDWADENVGKDIIPAAAPKTDASPIQWGTWYPTTGGEPGEGTMPMQDGGRILVWKGGVSWIAEVNGPDGGTIMPLFYGTTSEKVKKLAIAAVKASLKSQGGTNGGTPSSPAKEVEMPPGWSKDGNQFVKKHANGEIRVFPLPGGQWVCALSANMSDQYEFDSPEGAMQWADQHLLKWGKLA